MKEDIQKIKNSLLNLNIHVIPYCHADYAWTHTRQWHIDRYRLIINEVLEILGNNPAYTWMTDNIQHMLEPYLVYENSGESELISRIIEGRIEITNGILALIRPTMAGNEAFIRNIVLGRKFLKKLIPEYDTHVFHNVDVSIGHSQMPQLLNLSGYKYYRGWRPQGAMDAAGIPRQFHWKGLDGTRVLCSRGTYAGVWNAAYLNKEIFEDSDETLVTFYENELRDIIKNNKTGVIWLPFGMDDTRPLRDFSDTPVNFDAFVDYLNKSTGSHVDYSTAAQYFTDLSKENLPEITDVLDCCDVSYNIPTKGDKGLWHFRKYLDALVVKAEILWTMAACSEEIYPGEIFGLLWTDILSISGHAMEFAFSEDYEKIYKIALNSIKRARLLIMDAIKILASGIPVDSHMNYALFNTLGWERNEVVSIKLSLPAKTDSIAVFDKNMQPVDYQLCSSFEDNVQFSKDACSDIEVLVDAKIPAFGYASFSLGNYPMLNNAEVGFPDPNTQELIMIDTGAVKVVFQNGQINELNGNSPAHTRIGEISFTDIVSVPNDSWLHNDIHGQKCIFKPREWHWVEFGPLRWKCIVSGFLGSHGVRQEITLYKDKKLIDFNLDIECKEKSNGFFMVSFPTDEAPGITADIPFGIEKREVEKEIYGRATDIEIDNLERKWNGLFYAKSWITYKMHGASVSLMGEKSPGYHWHDVENKRVSRILTRTFNLDICTDWVKNTHPFNECIDIINFRYSLFVNPKLDDGFLPVIKQAEELRHKIEVCSLAKVDMGTKKIQSDSFLKMKTASCILSALYIENSKTIIRIYNASEKEDFLEIKTLRKILSFKSTDFFLNSYMRRHDLVCKDGFTLHTKMDPWEIITIALEFEL